MFAKYYKMSFVWKDSNVLHVLHSLRNFRKHWEMLLFFERLDVLYCVRLTACTVYKAGAAEMIMHVSMCATSVIHDRSTFFDVSQQCSSVFTHAFVISSVDISTHNSEMLMSVLLQNWSYECIFISTWTTFWSARTTAQIVNLCVAIFEVRHDRSTFVYWSISNSCHPF